MNNTTDLPQIGHIHWIGSPREPTGKWFRVTVTDRSASSVQGEVHAVTAWKSDYTPLEFELYLTFYMKWDGCCHITFGERQSEKNEQDGYLHLCGAHCFENHIWLMAELYRWAERAIPMERDMSGEFQPRT